MKCGHAANAVSVVTIITLTEDGTAHDVAILTRLRKGKWERRGVSMKDRVTFVIRGRKVIRGGAFGRGWVCFSRAWVLWDGVWILYLSERGWPASLSVRVCREGDVREWGISHACRANT